MVKSSKGPNLRIVPDKTAPKKRTGPAPAGDNVKADMEAFHYHLGVIVQLTAALKAATENPKKLLKKARHAAQDAGLNLEQLDRTIRNRDLEPETVKENLKREWQYNHWAGLAPGTQPDFFKDGPKVSEFEKAEQEGYVDGLEGVTAEGPRYDTANDLGQARLSGWHRGQKVKLDRFERQADDTNKAAAGKDGETTH